MKRWRLLQAVSVFMGSVLGAGFVSGQELYLFFGRFGVFGVCGLLLSMLLLSLFFYMLLRCLARDPLKKPCLPECRALSYLGEGIELSFLFVIDLIMASGVGALFEGVLGGTLARVLGALVFCAAVAFLICLGTTQVLRYFALVTPLLVLLAIGISVFVLLRGGWPTLSREFSFAFFPNALSYASYGFLGALGMFCALGRRINDRRTASLGAILGGVLLLLCAGAILFALLSSPAARNAELPMLAVAERVHPVLYYAYAWLLLVAMLGAALSVASPLFERLGELCRIRTVKGRVPLAAGLSLLVFGLSLFGFADLVGVLYPLYGYIGFLFLAFLLYNYLRGLYRAKR
ncbi:MAG: hypothetical protein IJW71_06815 [Clostridia bacterium]|nr:hypothetical protein [Clostridia bacterium]